MDDDYHRDDDFTLGELYARLGLLVLIVAAAGIGGLWLAIEWQRVLEWLA